MSMSLSSTPAANPAPLAELDTPDLAYQRTGLVTPAPSRRPSNAMLNLIIDSPQGRPITPPVSPNQLASPSTDGSMFQRQFDMIANAASAHGPVLEARFAAVQMADDPAEQIGEVFVIVGENEPETEVEVELQTVGAGVGATVSATANELFEHLQTAENMLDTGRGFLKTLQDLGLKDGLLTKLSDSLDQIKDVIDRTQALKQKIDNREILDAALAISALNVELKEAIASIGDLFKEVKEKIAELKACCSSCTIC